MNSSTKKGKRRRPYERPRHPRPMREGENDRQIVRLVYENRVLSQKQLERLLGRSPSTLQRLLRRLYEHRYLERLFLPVTTLGSSPALYILDKQGLELLQRMGIEVVSNIPSKSLSSFFLEHTLAINEFRIAVTQAVQAQGWELENWITDTELKADYDRVQIPGKARRVSLIPDSYFCIQVPDKGTAHFFLELDRGTMSSDRFKEKVQAYINYYKLGLYTKRYGSQSFRVLTVVDGVGEGRVQNLLDVTAKLKRIGKRFWFTHLEKIQSESVLTDAIWQIAGQEQRATLLDV